MAWLKKIKKSAIVAGIIFGLTSSMVSMLPTSHHSEAAIKVIDEDNIKEAITTAINTLDILTEAQKQVALAYLATQKITPQMILKFTTGLEANNQAIKIGNLSIPAGIFPVTASQQAMLSEWQEKISDVESLINGNMTVYDFVKKQSARHKALAQQAQNAAQVAHQTIKIDEEIMTQVKTALDESNNAVGALSVGQSGNAILAANVQATINNNRQQAQHIATVSAYYAAKNQEKAESEKMFQNSKDISAKWVENMQKNN